ncbi:DEP domain-containing protein 7-like isoform X1 [Synchiropus splendidus]|uniref:DEP domain-containing protein 7-like isoform X1 n=1 Tax=Synchiropus splendidus TaxID=270530 RepID=UPI00237E5EDB|nr:DEP domain-containing protein 7-like isoform X1 [Synchiropus splendidus]
MSSIRERAAALNLAEKLRARPQPPGAAVSSVRFTCLWNELLSHLRTSLTAKRHRVLLRSHSDCFPGSEVMDEVVSHVAREFQGAALPREALACVCQALLDCRVLESVTTKVFGRDKKVFQDSKSALYRFLGDHALSVDSLDGGLLEVQKLFRTLSAGRSRDESCAQVRAPQVSPEVPLQDTLVESRSPGSLSESCVGNTAPPSGDTSPLVTRRTEQVSLSSVAEETWQEQTLLRLLSLVELPLLEGVLQCTQASGPSSVWQRNPEVVPGGSALDRRVLQAFRESQADAWLCAALDLLDFLPDHSVAKLSAALPSCFPPEERDGSAHLAHCKTLVFGLLVRHYDGVKRAPLLPRLMADVYAAITDLLVKAKPDSALEALQLCLKLLPPGCREELRRLLTFMALAADAGEVRLDKEVSYSGPRGSAATLVNRASPFTELCFASCCLWKSRSEGAFRPSVTLQVENRLTVKRCFSRAILHSGSLSREKEELMVMFMLSNIQDIFKVPAELHKQVSDKLQDVVREKQPRPAGSDKTYVDSTRRELWALLSSIHRDTSRSSKERKRLLGSFRQAHPELFSQYFGDAASGLL